MQIIALCVSRDAKLWTGHLSREEAPGLNELHVSLSYFRPKLIKNSLSGWGRKAPEITGGMAAYSVLSDILKNSRNPNILDGQKWNGEVHEAVTKILKTAHKLAFRK